MGCSQSSPTVDDHMGSPSVMTAKDTKSVPPKIHRTNGKPEQYKSKETTSKTISTTTAATTKAASSTSTMSKPTTIPHGTIDGTASTDYSSCDHHEDHRLPSAAAEIHNNTKKKTTTTTDEVTTKIIRLSDQERKQKQKQQQQKQKQKNQPKLKPGYSSGGSSYTSERDDRSSSSSGGSGGGGGNNIAAAMTQNPSSNNGFHSNHSSSSNIRHDTLVNIKHELKAESDIACGVVRIESEFGRDIEDVYDGVHDGEILGTGIAGVVRKVKHRETGVYFASKCLNLGLVESREVLDSLREEIFIMSQLDHPNILRLEEVYENESQIFLIQELCKGGDLFDRLDDQPDIHFTEVGCAKLVKQMLSAVRYLHSRGIVHRDLKLENFLFSSEDLSDNSLKMIDFGLSKHFQHHGQILHDAVGTPYTAAPEIIRGSYDEKVDIWSMGVITYLLLSGESPFGGIDNEPLTAVRDNILACNVKFEPPYIWADVSADAKRFVKRLLSEKPNDRPTAREAQQDNWLQVYSNKDSKDCDPLNPKLVTNLCHFKEYSALHKVLLEVLSFTLLPEQIIDLKREFLRFDPDGVGEITLEELKQVLLVTAEAGSLGSLSESEVEDIFDALRVRSTDKTIRWHEFIAAGMSQSEFDDRNIKLAFDRLDYDHKGYITLEDLKEMLSSSDGRMDKAIFEMWQQGLQEVHCQGKAKLEYDDFRRLLKGQAPNLPIISTPNNRRSSCDASPRSPRSPRPSLTSGLGLPAPSTLMQTVPEGSVSPMTPREKLTTLRFNASDNLNIPSFPEVHSSPSARTSPSNHVKKIVEDTDICLPPDVSPRPSAVRSNSVKLDGSKSWLEDEDSVDGDVQNPALQSGRAYMRQAVDKFQELSTRGKLNDVASPAAANEAIFRTHRDFRRAVLEASKAFEQKQMAREVTTRRSSAKMTIRRGQRSDLKNAIANIEASSTVAEATRRSGRPRQRHARKKTASDLSEFLR